MNILIKSTLYHKHINSYYQKKKGKKKKQNYEFESQTIKGMFEPNKNDDINNTIKITAASAPLCDINKVLEKNKESK